MLTVGILAFASLSVINTPVLTLLAFCIAIPGLVACQPVFWCLPTRYLGGRRARRAASHLVVGLQCGGSDRYSGISANPALGAAVDRLIRQGGTAILSEIAGGLRWVEKRTSELGRNRAFEPGDGNQIQLPAE